MNIDIRNIDENFEDSINKLKREFYEKSNSKVIRRVAVNYLYINKQLEEERNRRIKAEKEIEEIKGDLESYFYLQKKLKSRK